VLSRSFLFLSRLEGGCGKKEKEEIVLSFFVALSPIQGGGGNAGGRGGEAEAWRLLTGEKRGELTIWTNERRRIGR